MAASHWSAYHARWARLGPPLRPHASVVSAMQSELAEHAGRTLLLGVTPELSDLGASITAVDKSEAMIAGVWPGDSQARRALRADWLELPFAASSFSAAVGDGSVNALVHPDAHLRVYAELARVLEAGGRAVIRVFRRPDQLETLEAIVADALDGTIENFHAFKWRLAMTVTGLGGSANVSVQSIYDAFQSLVPDRASFARRAGWELADVDTIDVYRGSVEVYSFPTGAELMAAARESFRRATLREVHGYALAERCPLLVLDV